MLYYRSGGKQKKLTIGQMGLAEARKEVARARVAIGEHLDPVTMKRSLKAMRTASSGPRKRAEARCGATPSDTNSRPELDINDDRLGPVAERYIREYCVPFKRSWPESARLLRRGIAPLADRRLSELTPSDFTHLLERVADIAPVVSNRLHSELSIMCRWASGGIKRRKDAQGKIAAKVTIIATNPFLNVPKVAEESAPRSRILDDREIALVWQAADALEFPYGDIFKLLLLTGARKSEVADAEWGEFDLTKRQWTLPASRSKNKRAHIIPLTDAAIHILTSLPRFAREKGETDYVFTPGVSKLKSFTHAKVRLDTNIAKLNGGKPIEHWVNHDIRRCVASGLARLGIPIHITEKVLNHVSGTFGGIVSVYQVHNYENEKRDALTRWSDHIESLLTHEYQSA